MPTTDNDVRVEFRDVPNELRQLGHAIAEAGMGEGGPNYGRDQVLWSICRLKTISAQDDVWDTVNDVLVMREDLEREAAR